MEYLKRVFNKIKNHKLDGETDEFVEIVCSALHFGAFLLLFIEIFLLAVKS